MKQGKIWGETEKVYSDGSTLSVHRIRILPGGYSSEHRHGLKANVFIVLGGRLEIALWPPGREVPDTTVLGPGETTHVPCGVWHMFRALEPVDCLELYHGTLVGEDIERRTQGGLA